MGLSAMRERNLRMRTDSRASPARDRSHGKQGGRDSPWRGSLRRKPPGSSSQPAESHPHLAAHRPAPPRSAAAHPHATPHGAAWRTAGKGLHAASPPRLRPTRGGVWVARRRLCTGGGNAFGASLTHSFSPSLRSYTRFRSISRSRSRSPAPTVTPCPPFSIPRISLSLTHSLTHSLGRRSLFSHGNVQA
jgi:hypothetical protein